MRGSAAFRAAVAPGGVLAGPWVKNELWRRAKAVPTLDLQFADNKSLVDATSGQNLVTFTRASGGTHVGSDGLIKNSVANLLLRSEEFDDASWGKTGLLAFGSGSTADAITAPNGTVTADLLTEDTGNSTHSLLQGATISAGSTLSVSLYVKPALGTRHIRIQLSSDAGANGFRAYFDLSQFSVAQQTSAFGTGSAVSDGANIVSAGDGWYRISCAGAVDGAATSAALNLFIQSTTTGSAIYTGDGTSGLYLWGAQLEQSSTVGEYIPTTSTINSAPRFDHDPTTGESLGLLVEEQRTNLVLQSQSLVTTPWSDGAATTSNAAIADVFGGTSASFKLTEDNSAAVAHYVGQSFTAAADTRYAVTAWYKVGSGDRDGRILLTNASAWNGSVAPRARIEFSTKSAQNVLGFETTEIKEYPNGWLRFTGVALSSATAGAFALRLLVSDGNESYDGNGTSYIYVGPCQLEAGEFPTSYIPTTTATVTRNADVVTITGTNFSSWYNQSEGTVFSEYISDRSTAFRYPFALADGTIDNRFLLFSSGTSTLNARLVASGVQTNPGNLSLLSAGSNKVCLAGATGVDNAVAASNGVLSSAATPSAMPLITLLYVGASHNGLEHLNGTIRRLTYFDRRLPNVTLQAITT